MKMIKLAMGPGVEHLRKFNIYTLLYKIEMQKKNTSIIHWNECCKRKPHSKHRNIHWCLNLNIPYY